MLGEIERESCRKDRERVVGENRQRGRESGRRDKERYRE